MVESQSHLRLGKGTLAHLHGVEVLLAGVHVTKLLAHAIGESLGLVAAGALNRNRWHRCSIRRSIAGGTTGSEHCIYSLKMKQAIRTTYRNRVD